MSQWNWPGSQILRVVDGDTVDALVRRDIGFGGWIQLPIRLRLNRINAPSIKSPAGKKAQARLSELLTGPAFDLVTVKPYKFGGPESMDGEWMAEITLPDGRLISDVMLAEKLAVPWNGDGPRPNDEG